jgi:hypothetical protein
MYLIKRKKMNYSERVIENVFDPYKDTKVYLATSKINLIKRKKIFDRKKKKVFFCFFDLFDSRGCVERGKENILIFLTLTYLISSSDR